MENSGLFDNYVAPFRRLLTISGAALASSKRSWAPSNGSHGAGYQKKRPAKKDKKC